MSERFVIVIQYDAAADTADYPLTAAMNQVRTRLHHPDQPGLRVVQVYAAIKDDAERVLDVFKATP